MTVAAAIPVYNEASTIAGILAAVQPFVDRVIVVDDGSTDQGANLAAAEGVEVRAHAQNRGYGAALQTALAWARANPDVTELVMIDADGQHNPSDIPRMVAELRARQVDVLVGSRFLGANNAPTYRLLGLHILTAAGVLGSGVQLTDSQSGYRVLSRRAIESLDLREERWAVQSEMLFEVSRTGLLLAETPTAIRYEGAARRSPIAHGVGVLVRTIVLTATRRPFRLPLLVATPIAALKVSRTQGSPSELLGAGRASEVEGDRA